MTEQEIKEILQSYVNQEMETVREDEMPGYEHVYSKKYEEKKNRLFFDERKFGKKFYFRIIQEENHQQSSTRKSLYSSGIS